MVYLWVASLFVAATVQATYVLQDGRYTITPDSLTTQASTSSIADQGIAALSTKDQKSKQDNWNNYVEFYGAYSGIFSAGVPEDVKGKVSVVVNFKGPPKTTQLWQWYLIKANGALEKMKSNSKKSWRWQMRRKTSKKGVAKYIHADGSIRLKLVASSGVDNCNIDYISFSVDQDPTAQTTTNPATTVASTSSLKLSIPAGVTWQWQLNGNIDTSFDVDVYDIDLFDAPQATIDSLKASGKTVVCYFSAGSYEAWRPDASQFPTSILGNKLDGWDERWLDIRNIAQANSALASIMRGRLDLAVSKGCHGVEPDNVDGYLNNNGLSLTASDQLTYNKFLAAEAHERQLLIALKNDVDQAEELEPHFDFAVVEQCYQYNECSAFDSFVDNNKAVLIAEYKSLNFVKGKCANAEQKEFSLIYKKLDLKATPWYHC
eukprot:m.68109 g.68109  ORF g.68109 m.68109 type:complete len:432 (+) comp14097_c0_seq1:98-1393(+)